GLVVRFEDYLEFESVSDRHGCLPFHFIPQSHVQVKTVSPNPAFPNQRAALARHRKMEHGGHFRQSELVEQSHETGPETADRPWARDEIAGDGLRRDMAEDCRGWQRRDASLSRLGSS